MQGLDPDGRDREELRPSRGGGAYLDGSLIEHLKTEIEERVELSGLESEDVAVLVFLQQRLARADLEAPTDYAAT